MIITDSQVRWEKFTQLAELADEVLISTYNLYTGISKDGHVIKDSKTRNARIFMNRINKASTRLLVGVSPYFPCKEDCEECCTKRISMISRFQHHCNQWPEMQIAFARELHLKLYLFKIDSVWVGFTGGMNLSASDWDDLLISIPPNEIPQLIELFNRLWDEKIETLESVSHWSPRR